MNNADFNTGKIQTTELVVETNKENQTIKQTNTETIKHDTIADSAKATSNDLLSRTKDIACNFLKYAKVNIWPTIKENAQAAKDYMKNVAAPYVKANVLPKIKKNAQAAKDYMNDVAVPCAKKAVSAIHKNINIETLKSYDKASIFAALIMAGKICSLPIIRSIPVVSYIPTLVNIFIAYEAVKPIMKAPAKEAREAMGKKIDAALINNMPPKTASDVSELD